MTETCLTEFKNNKVSVSENSISSYMPLCPNLNQSTVYSGGHGYTKVYFCSECKKELHIHDH